MFQDKVCVITGGALGIGRCLTREFAKVGAKIAFIDKNEQAGKENEAFLKQLGAHVYYQTGDIAEEEVLLKFTQEVVNEFGQVDILVNNACYSAGGIHTPSSFDDFNNVLKTGVTAPYMLTQLFLPHFNPGASVINMSSTRALTSQANTESYSAAKGAISALTHALAISLAGQVRVNAIAPGWIDTGKYHDTHYVPEYSEADIQQHPSHRVGEPEDIARAILFLCDDRNSFINGETLTIDGGMSKRMIYSGDEGWTYQPEPM